LSSLDLGLCQVTNEGVRALSTLQLESLFLAGTQLDDAAVPLLPRTLRSIGLVKTKVSAASMRGLAALPLLREADLRELGLSEDDVAPLIAREVKVRLR
jgi:hypothetical protein